MQVFSNGSTTPSLTVNLSGVVGPGDVHVLTHPSADPVVPFDQQAGVNWNGNDAVVLRKSLTTVDVIGQVGFDPGTEWGSGLTSTADNTLRRKISVVTGDANGADAFDPAVEWEGFATNTFDGLGSHTITTGGDSAPSVSSTSPANNATGVATSADNGMIQ